mgnify:CR=1 FL=1
METIFKFSFFPKFVSSYRTYEEWKLSLESKACLAVLRSYRTYEEWKRNRLVLQIQG